MTKEFYNANLAFLLNYTDGTKNDEIEYELFRILFQVKGMVHYDRIMGGSFENLEQESYNSAVMLKFVNQVIETVYRYNEERGFDPYIVVGYNDITTEFDNDGRLKVNVKYRVLQDLQKQGEIEVRV
jgi:hypothetical protein